MFWEKITGFLLMIFFHPSAAIAVWAASGFPWWQSFVFVMLWTSIPIIFFYFGAGKVKKLWTNNKIKLWWQRRSKGTKSFLFILAILLGAGLLTNWAYWGFAWWPLSWWVTYLLSISAIFLSMLLVFLLKNRFGGWIKKLANWIGRQKTWIIIPLAFIPTPMPGEGTAVVIAIRLLEIKHGFWILIAGNVLQSLISVVVLYYSILGWNFLF